MSSWHFAIVLSVATDRFLCSPSCCASLLTALLLCLALPAPAANTHPDPILTLTRCFLSDLSPLYSPQPPQLIPSSRLSMQTPSNFIFLTAQPTFEPGSCIFWALSLLAATVLWSCLCCWCSCPANQVNGWSKGIGVRDSVILVLSDSYKLLMCHSCWLQLHRMFGALALCGLSTCNRSATELLQPKEQPVESFSHSLKQQSSAAGRAATGTPLELWEGQVSENKETKSCCGLKEFLACSNWWMRKWSVFPWCRKSQQVIRDLYWAQPMLQELNIPKCLVIFFSNILTWRNTIT